ncbi:MAG: hypothetical protein HQK65_19695 [Desulfamplus sp.]|nr:hypothetical protein [Desulfamplus sp.]
MEKMKTMLPCSVTDRGYRSQQNIKTAKNLKHAFFGKMDDVDEAMREFCKVARSATEGFIAVAKNLRGMGKSLYRGIKDDQIWIALGQTAYNLKKFVQLYRDEQLGDDTLQYLGFIT